MVQRALLALSPETGSLVFVENVGNLVCPALFDIGEHAKAVVISVTEGDDKPIKYPHMFAAADVVVVNKTDLLPRGLRRGPAGRTGAEPQPGGDRATPSVKTGEGLDTWLEWLERLATSVPRPGPNTSADAAKGAPVDNQSVRETSARIDEVLDELGQSALPPVMERVEELLRCVMSLYGAGLDHAPRDVHDVGGEDASDGSPTTRWSATCSCCTTCTPTTS